MDLEDIIEKEEELKIIVKKNCMLCMGRSRLGRPKNPEKKTTIQALNTLYNLYEKKFNLLRKNDAEGNEIQKAGNNKRIILDIISECETCNQEIEKANRKINEL